MMKKPVSLLISLMILLMLLPGSVSAQNDLAATLEVLAGGVTVQRVNTSNPITISVEAIVGVGDVIRTDDSGRARITFFADGTDVEILPNTEYRIEEFSGDDAQFTLTVEVIAGQTRQRLNRLLDANSSYRIRTPGMALAARGTEFAIRVEDDGRSAMLVAEGLVAAEDDEDDAIVPEGFGVRSAVDEPLSDVVRATTFAELDSALDGCTVNVSTFDDTRLNVRIAPSIDAPRVGTIDGADIPIFIGALETGDWYRIPFRDGFGWVLASAIDITGGCAGLRTFAGDHVEDPNLYAFIGDPIDLDLTAPFVPPITPSDDEAEADDEAINDEIDADDTGD